MFLPKAEEKQVCALTANIMRACRISTFFKFKDMGCQIITSFKEIAINMSANPYKKVVDVYGS